MILSDHAQELIEKVVALSLSKAIDMLNVVADGEDGLPAGNGVGADDGVHSGELSTDIVRGATSILV